MWKTVEGRKAKGEGRAGRVGDGSCGHNRLMSLVDIVRAAMCALFCLVGLSLLIMGISSLSSRFGAGMEGEFWRAQRVVLKVAAVAYLVAGAMILGAAPLLYFNWILALILVLTPAAVFALLVAARIIIIIPVLSCRRKNED